MSLFKKLFGGGGAETKATAQESHNGYSLTATPMPENGQFRLAGKITREIDGELREHQLIRADVFPSAEDASQQFLFKAKRLIDEQGDGIFSK